jgi:hypothetical protein
MPENARCNASLYRRIHSKNEHWRNRSEIPRNLVPPKPIVQVDQLSAEDAQNVLGELRQIGLLPFYDSFREIDGPRNAASDDDAKLRRQAAKHVDQLSALADHEVPCPVQGQKRLLFFGLDLDKPHRRAGHRLADRLSIGGLCPQN